MFIKRTPISEACRGILTIFKNFSIDYNKQDYFTIKKQFNKIKLTDKDIFKKSKVSSVVMTNNPFNLDEWSLFKKKMG